MTQRLTAVAPVSDGAQEDITYTFPYKATVTIQGVCTLLFHAWNNEAVAEKSNAAKGSKSKKTDNLESYVYRTPDGHLGIRGDALRAAIIQMGRYRQDPRSPRKSAVDLLKAGVISLTPIADLGVNNWDYIDRQRAVVQRAAITRERPAMREGWQATFEFFIAVPEYIAPGYLNDLIAQAGRLSGLYDYRPTYGRFRIISFKHEPYI